MESKSIDDAVEELRTLTTKLRGKPIDKIKKSIGEELQKQAQHRITNLDVSG